MYGLNIFITHYQLFLSIIKIPVQLNVVHAQFKKEIIFVHPVMVTIS